MTRNCFIQKIILAKLIAKNVENYYTYLPSLFIIEM
jgi:hypothetical protein